MRRRDLTFRLAIAFAFVAIATAVIAAVVISVTWQRQFEVYVQRGVQERADDAAATLSQVYADAGSWETVTFVNLAHLGITGEYRLLVLDADGEVVAYSQGRMGGMMTDGTPPDATQVTARSDIVVEGEVVG